MLRNLRVAKKYATAIFDVSVEQKCIEAVLKDIIEIKEVFNRDSYSNLCESGTKNCFQKINDPIYRNADRIRVVNNVSDKMRFHKLTARLLLIIADNKRLDLLGEISDHFLEIKRNLDGEKLIEVASSQRLSNIDLEEIKNFLAKKLKKKIIINNTIDASLIGGVIIKIDSLVLDNSVANKLNNIKLSIRKKFNVTQTV